MQGPNYKTCSLATEPYQSSYSACWVDAEFRILEDMRMYLVKWGIRSPEHQLSSIIPQARVLWMVDCSLEIFMAVLTQACVVSTADNP